MTPKITRRDFMKYSLGGAAVIVTGSGLSWLAKGNSSASLLIPVSSPVNAAISIPPAPGPLPGGTLDPTTIPKYVDALPVPGVMPTASSTATLDYYEIAVTQFQQQVLSTGMPATTVWGYGGSYPAATIEARYKKPVRVKWINGLVDANNNYLPHLLPVDQTLSWANPPGGIMGRDMPGTDPAPYAGPVPIVSHLHGAHVTEESDGYPTAWYLPAAGNIPDGYAKAGSQYDAYQKAAEKLYGQKWTPGSSVFQYPNDQRATTLWFHDHSMGMTRANVYAGPSGFYVIRGGPDDLAGGLPSGAYEIPIIIQDKSFNAGGSLFYPDNRAFFEGKNVPGQPQQFPGEGELQIPLAPDAAIGGPSDIAPIWNPEFFGNTMVVNGKTWPYLQVEQRRYRMRFLNACDSRFLMLDIPAGVKAWVIGADGGFLSTPVQQTRLLIAPAERLDVIMDFTAMAVGNRAVLRNVAPDEPFGGGQPGADFAASNPDTTGQVMQFRVVRRVGKDTSTAPDKLVLPAIAPISGTPTTRYLSLNELASATVPASEDGSGNIVLDANGEPWAPQSARLGTYDVITGVPAAFAFMDEITEDPRVGKTEIWEIRNFTADAHPIHIHQIQFQVIGRVDQFGKATGPEPWETGFKDTAIMYPGDEGANPGITRVKVKFDIAGLYLWHCHILSHEDNEMMRPIEVVR